MTNLLSDSACLRRFIIAKSVLVLLFAAVSAPAEAEDPASLCRSSADRFGSLDVDKAYELGSRVTRDFPQSKEAGKAYLLKVMVMTTKLQAFGMLSRKYGEAMAKSLADIRRKEAEETDEGGSRKSYGHRELKMRESVRKALVYEYSRKNKRLYAESTQTVMDSGKVLVSDLKPLFAHVGKPMSVQVRKRNSSLTLFKDSYSLCSMLEQGYPPKTEEGETKIEMHHLDVAFCYVLGRSLKGVSKGSAAEAAKRFEKKQVISDNVDWAGLMMVTGDSLVQYAVKWKVGWTHPAMGKSVKNLEEARIGYVSAVLCFKKVIELTKHIPNDKRNARAKQRIMEIQKALKEIAHGR